MEVMDKVKNKNRFIEDKKNHSVNIFNEKDSIKKEKETDKIPENSDDSYKWNSTERARIVSVFESLLFASDKPVGVTTFKQVFEDSPPDGVRNPGIRDIKKILQELKLTYGETSRGICLEEINGGWQLRTKPENREFLKKLNRSRPFKLSGPALEVLSMIAYRQPIIKSEVDRIRGVESGHLIRSLMEKKLISFQGKSDLPGKPLQYGTTARFLEVFGLKNLKELPSLEDMDQLLPDGIGGEENDKEEKLSDITDKVSRTQRDFGSYGEEEWFTIGETIKKIKTTPDNFPESENCPEEGEQPEK